MDGIEVLGVPVTDFDPYCLKHGEERRELFKSATLEDAGLKRFALLKYFLPKKPSEKRRFTDFAPIGVSRGRESHLSCPLSGRFTFDACGWVVYLQCAGKYQRPAWRPS
jgi:hypothetical protein